MILLLWEMGNELNAIVLYDGKCTYWSDDLIPSPGYENLILDEINEVTQSRFTLIGVL
jgi:hypothetical protein